MTKTDYPLKERLFGLDARSLALFRIALGSLVAIDALDRLRDLGALYTEAGAFPSVLAPPGGVRAALPFHVMGQELAGLWLVVMFFAGVAMALGWRTRIFTLVCWALQISIQARNPWVMYGADLLIRTLLFWGIFLPLNQVWSLDRRAGRAKAPERTPLTVATLAYTLQIAVLYLVTGILKSGHAWFDGTAGWYALQIDTFTGPIGVWMRNFPTILWASTLFIIVLEYVGSFILFVPWKTTWFRMAILVPYVVFHISLEVMLQIGWFPWISVTCWLPLIPGEVWDRLGWWEETVDPRPRLWPSRVVDVFVGACLFVVLWWNLATVAPNHFAVRGPIRIAAFDLRLDQNWNMYAPSPLRDDGWWRADATLADGTTLDLITGRRPVLAKPADVPGHYGSSRWNKFMRSMWSEEAKERQTAYADWRCRTWNQSDEGKENPARQVTLTYVKKMTPRPGAKQKPVTPVKVTTLSCDTRPKVGPKRRHKKI
jgi:hypothetical protein